MTHTTTEHKMMEAEMTSFLLNPRHVNVLKLTFAWSEVRTLGNQWGLMLGIDPDDESFLPRMKKTLIDYYDIPGEFYSALQAAWTVGCDYLLIWSNV